MSLPRDPLRPVPAETARTAHAAFPAGNVYMRLHDEVGTLFDDEQFTTVSASEGQPALHPWQLAMVSVMQFAENLSDRQAADAVRARMDWKYALGLELSDEGFHYAALSEFRTRLVEGSLEAVESAAGSKRGDGNAPIRRMCWERSGRSSPLELVGETLRATLNVLARCGARLAQGAGDARLVCALWGANRRLSPAPRQGGTRGVEPAQAGMDWLQQLPAVQTLEQTWAQQ